MGEIKFWHFKLLVLFVSVTILASCSSPKLPVKLSSPNGKNAISFDLKKDPQQKLKGERAWYSVSNNGKMIIQDSPLGLLFKDDKPLDENFKVVKVKKETQYETYHPVYGTEAEIVNRYHAVTITLQEHESPNRKFDLQFRAYDDGVAFRYILQQQKGIADVEIINEKSEFHFPENHNAYALQLGSFTTNYETEYDKLTLSEVGPDAIIGMPILIELKDGPYIAITEANLTNYAGMYLSGVEGSPNTLVSRLSPLPDGGGVCVKGSLPLATPWRVIMIAADQGKLIESNIILNLNEPCAIEDPSWIKPGKVAWDWWANQTVKGVDFVGGMNTATMKHYIDFASEVGFEYMLIDAKWYGPHKDPNADITTTIPEIDIPDILQHAKSKGVDVILWVNWLSVKRQMDVAFPLYEKWGVAGIKVDYMNRDDQEMVKYYHDVVKKAAAHHLIVDFHGAYKPTGIRRTWPNLITREGVLGLEYSKWSKRCTPEHAVTIPFIRMLAGPMDFTSGAFRTATKESFEPKVNPPMAQGTRCHQLAMFVVFESPLQVCVDYPSAYRGETGLEFLKQVPTTWDKTKVINAKVADYITIARQHGEEWYVGSMTDWDARILQIPLDFLGDGDYVAHIFSDGPDADRVPNNVTTLKVLVTATDTIKAKLAPGGGQAIWIEPAPEGTVLPRYKTVD